MSLRYSEISAIADYLSASGAVAISDVDGVAVATQWLDRNFVERVRSTASQLMACHAAPQALEIAANFHSVRLTPDGVAKGRAVCAIALLAEYERAGLLRTFNAEYRRRRLAGQTRMSFCVAKKRFVRLLIERLTTGGVSDGLIDAVFCEVTRDGITSDFVVSPW